MNLSRRILSLALGLLLFGPRLALSQQLLAGAASEDITPQVEPFEDKNLNGKWERSEPFDDLNDDGRWNPVWLAGFDQGRPAMEVHDRLWARSLALSGNDRHVVLVALDLIGFMGADIDAVKRTLHERIGVPPANIVIASTHTHHGPDTIGLWGPMPMITGRDEAYQRRVRGAIVRCVERAWEARRPARLRFGRSSAPEVLKDSRDPVVMNPAVLSLQAIGREENTIAVLVNYAMHPEVLPRKNPLVTSDYVHFLRESLEERFGGTALFFAGDLGGMQTPRAREHTFEEARRIGELLAQRSAESLLPQSTVSGLPLEVFSRRVEFPVTNPIFRAGRIAGLFGDLGWIEEEEGGQKRFLVDATVCAIRLGPAQLVTAPGEVFPELGHRLRGNMRGPFRFFLGLANNELGYILPEEQFDPRKYEETMSLGKATGPILEEALAELLHRGRLPFRVLMLEAPGARQEAGHFLWKLFEVIARDRADGKGKAIVFERSAGIPPEACTRCELIVVPKASRASSIDWTRIKEALRMGCHAWVFLDEDFPVTPGNGNDGEHEGKATLFGLSSCGFHKTPEGTALAWVDLEHPAMKLFTRGEDPLEIPEPFQKLSFHRFHQLLAETDREELRVVARLGLPELPAALLEVKVGEGGAMVAAFSPDATSSNFPLRPCFVVFWSELLKRCENGNFGWPQK